MNTKRLLAWASVGVFSALIFAEAAWAFHYKPKSSSRARAEIRSDRAEIHRDRAELRRDIEEFHRDRADLHRAYRRGASPAEISQRRAELRRDLDEIAQDRRELRRDYAELNRDRTRYDWYRQSDGRSRYPAYSYGRSNWDRWGHGYSGRRHNEWE